MPDYYIWIGNQAFGPISADELRRMAADGRIKPDQWICVDGQNWIAARDVADLFQAAAIAPLPGFDMRNVSSVTAFPPSPSTPSAIERPQAQAANMIRGFEAVGGRLHFEENQMIFKSHAFNIQTGNTSIPYSEIESIARRNTLWIAPNGILVRMKSGVEYKFVIWNRNALIKYIQSRMIIDTNSSHIIKR